MFFSLDFQHSRSPPAMLVPECLLVLQAGGEGRKIALRAGMPIPEAIIPARSLTGIVLGRYELGWIGGSH
jgi:hypothetical protein